MMIESFGIAGTGRVAEAIATVLDAHCVPVHAFAGRNAAKLNTLATRFHAEAVAIPELPSRVRAGLIAVSDDALESVANELKHSSRALDVALHTSGSAGPDALAVLRERGTAVGVLHPLQTVPTAIAGAAALPRSGFAYAGDNAAQQLARELIGIFEGKPLAIDADRWAFYHAAAVMASNYQATLMDAALELLEGAGVSRVDAMNALTPLFREANRNVQEYGPEAALTGPIRRGDVGTVIRHIQALRAAPVSIRNLYACAAQQTVCLAERAGLPYTSARAIENVLASVSAQAAARDTQPPSRSGALCALESEEKSLADLAAPRASVAR